MSKIHTTQSGTHIVDSIEYNQYPPPSMLLKATKRQRALRLRDEGIIRLNSINFYQELESPELGDINEGKGMLKLNGHPMVTGSTNEVFVWCSATPEASVEVLKGLDPAYNTIVQINDVQEFTNRIVLSAKSNGYELYPHVGKVNYTRGEEVSKEVLNNQQWHHNIFQKSPEYAHQNEYRLSFSNFTLDRTRKNHLDLTLGDCSDIILVEI